MARGKVKTVDEKIADCKAELRRLEAKKELDEIKPELIKKIKACNSLPLIKALDDFVEKESAKYDKAMKINRETE